MWSRFADRLILRPSRHPIDCESQRRWVDWAGGRFEAWIHPSPREADLLVLKFPGTGGRAERSSTHPADCWDDVAAEVWTVNPPGYGGSPGRASMAHKMAVAEAAWNAVQQAADGRPVVVTGNSLGSLPAIYLAARHPLAGLLLRNPVPLRELIRSRYGPRSLWLGAALIARQVPQQLCPIRNAAQAAAPAVIVSSSKDRVVPPQLQQRVISQYGGEARVVHLREADHADPPSEDELPQYVQELDWLRQRVLASQSRVSPAP